MTAVTEKGRFKLVRALRAGTLEVQLDGEKSDILTILVNGKLQIKPNKNSRLSRETDITLKKYQTIDELQNHVYSIAKKTYTSLWKNIRDRSPEVTLTYTLPNGLKTEYPDKE